MYLIAVMKLINCNLVKKDVSIKLRHPALKRTLFTFCLNFLLLFIFFFLIYNVYKKHIFKFLCERTKLEPQTLVDQLNQLPDSRIFFSLQ